MNTDDLIDRLARNLSPVEALRRPRSRAAAWWLAATVYVVILTATMTSAADLAAVGAGPRLWLPHVIAIVTSLLAATAAFASVVPGHSKHILVWPVIALLAWFAALLMAPRPLEGTASVVAAQGEWLCIVQILVGGAPLVAILAAMVRRGAPLHPVVTGAFVAIAVGALSNVGACVTHPHTDPRVTLAWHGAAMLALVIVCAAGARFVLSWSATARRAEG